MDETLLAEARQAQERLIDAECDADMARADFHRALRRLHLHGASLRELAGTFGLSHQRVHQIVESAGGSRRWLRGSHTSVPAPQVACTFCGRDRAQGAKLIAGPHAYICDTCVPQARAVITAGPRPGGPFVPVILTPEHAKPQCEPKSEPKSEPESEPEGEPQVKLACSFCGKQRHQVVGLAASSIPPAPGPAPRGLLPRATVCIECLDLCDEIFAEEPAENGNPT
jgi:ClpX C4-type zinc finger protein